MSPREAGSRNPNSRPAGDAGADRSRAVARLAALLPALGRGARRLSAAVCAVFLAVVPSVSLAGQEPKLWEINVFGARTSLDGQDPFSREKTAVADFDGDGTATVGLFSRSLDIKDDTFLGIRLGYVWGPYLETELVYDRNHASATYRHSAVDLGGGGTLQEVEGGASTIFTSYQVGFLFHPLGKRITPWQPYVTAAAGWMDVDFAPSKSLESQIHGGPAENAFGVEFDRQDHGVMVGYGAGLKYFLRDVIAIRAEVRGKGYELFGERRNDYEISLGMSFFAPSANP